MHTTKERVADATSHVRPYVERAIRDEELRRNVKDAYTSARALYEQLLTKNDVSHVATKLVSDEEVQAQLRNVVAQLRSAAGPSSAFASTSVSHLFFRLTSPTCRTLSL